MFPSRIVLSSLVVSAWFGYLPHAVAHIRLSDPVARYEITGIDTGIKGCPCGLATGGGNSNRTCNVEKDGSDPARDEARASTFPAGSTITLKFEEYIAHGGRYRVAFDAEGADFEDFNANVIHDETDPSGSNGNVGDGNKWEIEVKLPDMECDNCTLQLLQVMDVDTDTPVDGSKLANSSTYYTCIDLKLTAPEGSTDEPSSDTSSDEGSSSAEDSSATDSSDSSSSAAASSSREETTAPSTSREHESTSERTSTSTAPTTPSVAPPNPSSTATPAPTTSGATATSAGTTTSVNTAGGSETSTDDNQGGEMAEPNEGGCNVAFAREPAASIFAAIGALVLGMLVRRKRA